MDSRPRERRWAVHVLSLAPLLAVVWRALGPGFGPDPAGWAVRRTGDVALALLVLSLVPGAVRRLAARPALLVYRRPLGLYAFCYAALHLLCYVVLSYGGAWDLMRLNLQQNRFVLLGLATFAILLALAITSTARAQRRLGRWWQPLHRLVYLAALLDVWHYAWSFKEWRLAPLAVVAVVVSLLLLRVPAVVHALQHP